MKQDEAFDLLDAIGKVFPGEIAGASLKPRLDARAGGGVGDVFPGEIAGASLKRRHLARVPEPPEPFSPAKSPGPH